MGTPRRQGQLDWSLPAELSVDGDIGAAGNGADKHQAVGCFQRNRWQLLGDAGNHLHIILPGLVTTTLDGEFGAFECSQFAALDVELDQPHVVDAVFVQVHCRHAFAAQHRLPGDQNGRAATVFGYDG